MCPLPPRKKLTRACRDGQNKIAGYGKPLSTLFWGRGSNRGAQNGPFSTWSFLKWTIIRKRTMLYPPKWSFFKMVPFQKKDRFGNHKIVLFQMVCSRPLIFVSRWTSDLRVYPLNLKSIWIQKVNGPEQTI